MLDSFCFSALQYFKHNVPLNYTGKTTNTVLGMDGIQFLLVADELKENILRMRRRTNERTAFRVNVLHQNAI